MITTWRGVPLDPRSADMAEAAASRSPRADLRPTQGSFRPPTRYSADTHTGAGALDLSTDGLTPAELLTTIMVWRGLGWAIWHRSAIPGLWADHLHAIALPPDLVTNTHHLSPGAMDQVRDYLAGRDGLAGHHTDPHPRPPVIRSWEQTTTRPPKGITMTEDQMDTLAAKIAKAIWTGTTYGVRDGSRMTVGQLFVAACRKLIGI